jgi:hypothetical protein
MKTLEEINQDIRNVELEMMDGTTPKRRYKTLETKLKLLRQIKMYLETNPSEEFIELEINRINTYISSKQSQFEYWKKNVCPQHVDTNKRKALFEREVGIPHLKKQLKTLKYLTQ